VSGHTRFKTRRKFEIKSIFDKLHNSHTIYYSPTEQFAVDKITVLFKGRIIFKQYTLNAHTKYNITQYKPCDSKDICTI